MAIIGNISPTVNVSTSSSGLKVHQSLRYNISGFYSDVTVNYTVPASKYTQVTITDNSAAKWQATAGTAMQFKYDYNSTHFISFDGVRIFSKTGSGFYAYIITWGN